LILASNTIKDYLEERARRDKRKNFEALLAKVPDAGPDESDRL